MEQIIIEINTGNDAFHDDPGREVARILRELAAKYEQGEQPQITKDLNGAKVGNITYK